VTSVTAHSDLAYEQHSLPRHSPSLDAAQSHGSDSPYSLHTAALDTSIVLPHETCSAAQRVRECYPEIFQQGQSPAFPSSWSAPVRGLSTSCAIEDLSMSISMSISRSTDAHVVRASTELPCSPIDAAAPVPLSSSAIIEQMPAAPERFLVEGGSVPHQFCGAAISRLESGDPSIDQSALVSGLSERAQRLLSLGRVQMQKQALPEHRKVDASVDHWAVCKAQASSDCSIGDILGPYRLSDASIEDILAAQKVAHQV
jgi:hypothetical protein